MSPKSKSPFGKGFSFQGSRSGGGVVNNSLDY